MNEEQPSYYAILVATVRYDNVLSPNAKLLYAEITALSNKHGYCWASNAYFAHLYDVDKRTITRWVAQLAERGHIKISMDENRQKRRIKVSNALPSVTIT